MVTPRSRSAAPQEPEHRVRRAPSHLQTVTPSRTHRNAGAETADSWCPGRRRLVTERVRGPGRAGCGVGLRSRGRAGAGAGHASHLLLRRWPGGGGGLCKRHEGPRLRSGRRKRRGCASLRVRRRCRPHGAQRALLDHRTPSMARDARGRGQGGRGA